MPVPDSPRIRNGRVGGRHQVDLLEDGRERRALANDFPEGERLPDLLPEIVALELELLTEPLDLFERARVGDSHGGVVGEGTQPFELGLLDLGATEHSQHP